MTKELLLGIDLGTSYFKVGLFDRAGTLLGLGRVAVPSVEPQPGWCELPVDGFLATLRSALGEAMMRADASPGDIRGVSYSSQANTFVLLDAGFTPLTPLVMWTDRRAADMDPRVCALWARADFVHRAGFHMEAPEFAVAKWRWFERHAPELWGRTAHIMTISDYLAWMLTGELVGDQSTASLMGIWQPQAGEWWAEGLAAAGVTQDRLSTLLPPGTRVSATCASAQRTLGLPAGIPVAVGAVDHVAAAYAAGIGSISPCCDSTGTVIAVVYLTDSYDPKPDYCTGRAAGGRFCKLAYHANGASLLEWHQKRSAPGCSVGGLIADAFAPDIVPPFPEIEVSDDSARRVEFSNASPNRGLSHQTRALVEMLTANLAELVARVAPQGSLPCILATGGGARSPEWLRLKADTIGVPFVTVQNPEPACFGAALFASAAAGWFPDVTAASSELVRVAARFDPQVRSE